jgi:hypothetical protein
MVTYIIFLKFHNFSDINKTTVLNISEISKIYSYKILIIFYFLNKCSYIFIRVVWDILTKNEYHDFNLNSTNCGINHNCSFSNFKDDDLSPTTQLSLKILQIYSRKIYIIFSCVKDNDVNTGRPKEVSSHHHGNGAVITTEKLSNFPYKLNNWGFYKKSPTGGSNNIFHI